VSALLTPDAKPPLPARLLKARVCRLLAFILVALALPQLALAQSAALDALVAAYPDFLSRHDATAIYWKDGSRMPVADRAKDKSFAQLLRNASILDQFRLHYPRGALSKPPSVNDDPGRFRNEVFFNKMYGDCRKGQVARHLVAIRWLPRTWGKKIFVTSINGIDRRLTAVSAEIDALPASIKRAAYPIAGVSSCRPVADTGKPSMHSYAAAIDLNLRVSDYWRWHEKTGPIRHRNRMPQQIVDIFERHGFIWGGKWYHYDTMHFEYRPELLGMSGKR
jgi:D-alanyl-D-alanine carboxypeptidase